MNEVSPTNRENHSFLSYILTIFFTFLALAFSANVISSIFDLHGKGEVHTFNKIHFYGKNLYFLMQLFPFLIAFLVLLLCAKFVHKMNLKKLFIKRDKFQYKDFLLSFFLIGILLSILLVVDFFTSDKIKWNFSSPNIYFLLLICLFFVSIQTLFEEILFRSYLLNGLQKAFQRPIISILLSSILFGLMHASNPEIEIFGKEILLYFVYTGVFLALMSYYNYGIEIAFGFHWMNNLFATLILTNNWQVFQTDALFKNYAEPKLGMDFWITAFLFYPLIFCIFTLKNKWQLGSIFVSSENKITKS